MKGRTFLSAFSLIEVVVALAIMSFALIAIFGLFAVGLKTGKESSDQIQAANLASLLISTRRGAPTNTMTTFALPPLNAGAQSGTNTVSIDGTTTASAAPGGDTYKMAYTITPSTILTNEVNVYLLLWWPAAASAPLTNTPGAYYEVSTQILLP